MHEVAAGHESCRTETGLLHEDASERLLHWRSLVLLRLRWHHVAAVAVRRRRDAIAHRRHTSYNHHYNDYNYNYDSAANDNLALVVLLRSGWRTEMLRFLQVRDCALYSTIRSLRTWALGLTHGPLVQAQCMPKPLPWGYTIPVYCYCKYGGTAAPANSPVPVRYNFVRMTLSCRACHNNRYPP